MAAQDDLSTIVDQLLDGGQSRIDAVLVGDHAVLHRDIEIAADKDLLAAVSSDRRSFSYLNPW